MTQHIRSCHLWTLVICMGWPGGSQAGFITQAGVVGGSSPGAGTGLAFYDQYWEQGSFFSAASGSLGGSSGSASVGLISNPGIRLYSASISEPSLGVSQSTVGASWVDVIRVAGATPPDILRVVLDVSGKILVNFADGIGATARVGVGQAKAARLDIPFSGFPTDLGALASGNGYTVSEVFLSDQGPIFGRRFISTNTADLSFDPVTGAISWKAIFDLPYSVSLGGYGLNLYAAARTDGSRGSDAVADFASTIRLTGATLADGSPVQGTVTFESGFTLSPAQAVPEPASLALLGSAAISAAGFLGLRRRRSASR